MFEGPKELWLFGGAGRIENRVNQVQEPYEQEVRWQGEMVIVVKAKWHLGETARGWMRQGPKAVSGAGE